MSEKVLELRLHPLGLVTQGSVVYLVATANDYSDIRLYALHRFKQASRTFEKSKPPKGFSLDRYIEEGALQFGEGAEIDLVALVSDDLVRILMETPIATNQVIKAKGDRWQINATLFDTWQLRWWILSRGHGIKVLKPLGLVREIAETVKKTAKLYE